nr:MAG TPA: hypothetical protein [Caudoviricetes sp.]
MRYSHSPFFYFKRELVKTQLGENPTQKRILKMQ